MMLKVKLVVALSIAALSLGAGSAPSYAAGDCPPSTKPFWYRVLENGFPVGGPSGGGLHLQPIVQLMPLK